MANSKRLCVVRSFDGQKLQVADVALIERKLCADKVCSKAKALCHLDFADNGLACADTAKPNKICDPRLGSPLVCGEHLYGVLSVPFPCAPGKKAVFGDVRAILEVMHAAEDELDKKKKDVAKYKKKDSKKDRKKEDKQSADARVASRAARRPEVFWALAVVAFFQYRPFLTGVE
ncbi:Hypothetical protein NTJ_11631 [Nesidiocoris tenuis]|nr:Hypothetical protein NTJ_11631 [Nesidiocoris tenuis]